MATGYRAVLRIDDGQDAVRVVEEQLRSWLREKVIGRRATLETADWDGQGTHRVGSNALLRVVEEDDARDRSRRRLYRLLEKNSGGVWTVSIYAASLLEARRYRQSIVVEVDVEGATREEAIVAVGTPRIVRMILEAAGSYDGEAPLEAQPAVVASGETERVLRAVADLERNVSVVVAASPSRRADSSWRKAIDSLTRESVGVASVFVVQADAFEELNEFLPSSHAVEPGRVRTFLPRVDFEDPADATRHMRLGPATLSRSLSGTKVARPLQIRHSEGNRRRLIELDLPPDIRRNLEILRRAEMNVVREAEVASRIAEEEGVEETDVQPSLPEQESRRDSAQATAAGRARKGFREDWGRAIELLRRWLKVEDPGPARFDDLDRFIEKNILEGTVAREQLGASMDRVLELEMELGEARSRIDDLEIDLTQAEQDNVAQQDELATLRQRIAVSDKPQDAYVEPVADDWKAPESVAELLNRITPGRNEHAAFKRVVFTGDEASALEIDRRYTLGMYAASLWQFVRVLHDYAEARCSGSFSGNVHMYLTDEHVTGTKCSPARHAATESETVLNNSKWRAERVLPVPSSVDTEGRVLMSAHFKPTHRDTFAPRLHYYDDVAGSGQIYIGYIGRHLTNTRS